MQLPSSLTPYIGFLRSPSKRAQAPVFTIENFKVIQEILLRYPQQQIIALISTRHFHDRHTDFFTAHAHIPLHLVKPHLLQSLSALHNNEQLLAILPKKTTPPFHYTPEGFIPVLDGIQNPSNLGSLIRTADWFGIKDIICSYNSVSVYNAKCLQSSMGSWLRLRVHYKHLGEFLPSLPACPIFATCAHIHTSFRPLNKQCSLPKNGIILIGGEHNGLSKEVAAFATHRLHIPAVGGGESLNINVATAIILHQLTGRNLYYEDTDE